MDIKTAEDIEKAVAGYLASGESGSMARHIYRIRADWKLILEPESSKEVQTACISKGEAGSSIVRFNAGFLKRHVVGPDGLVFVFLHELMHALNGDLVRNFDFDSMLHVRLANVVEDIKINSSLLRHHYKKGWQFLSEFYARPTTAVGMLLCPPFTQVQAESGEINKPDFPAKVAVAASRRRIKDRKKVTSMVELGRWYADAWLKDLPVKNLLDRLYTILKAASFSMHDVIFLGSHGGQASHDDDDPEELGIEDFGDTLRSNERAVSAAIQKSLEQDGDKACSTTTLTTMTGVVPTPGRREAFLLSAGLTPMFYKNSIEAAAMEYQRLNLYVDTSGSVIEELPFVYKLLKNVKNYLSDPVYLFSGRVEPISVRDFLNKKAKSNYCTRFNGIFQHAFDHDFEKLLIITDGEDYLDSGWIDAIKSRHMEIYVLLTKQDREYSTVLNKVARKVWVLRRW